MERGEDHLLGLKLMALRETKGKSSNSEVGYFVKSRTLNTLSGLFSHNKLCFNVCKAKSFIYPKAKPTESLWPP